MGLDVHIDIVIRSEATEDGLDLRSADVSNVEAFQANDEYRKQCKRWLASQGMTSHSTHVGLACTTSSDIFRRSFNVSGDHTPEGDIPIPDAIAAYVARLTVSRAPDFFG